jgi:hypothetical protein
MNQGFKSTLNSPLAEEICSLVAPVNNLDLDDYEKYEVEIRQPHQNRYSVFCTFERQYPSIEDMVDDNVPCEFYTDYYFEGECYYRVIYHKNESVFIVTSVQEIALAYNRYFIKWSSNPRIWRLSVYPDTWPMVIIPYVQEYRPGLENYHHLFLFLDKHIQEKFVMFLNEMLIINWQKRKFKNGFFGKHYAHLFDKVVSTIEYYGDIGPESKSYNLTKSIEEKLFDSRKFEGTRLPRVLYEMTIKQVAPLIGSLYLAHNDLPKNPQEAKVEKEYRRSLNEVRLNWEKSDENLEKLKSFLVGLYTGSAEILIAHPHGDGFKFVHYKYQSNPEVFLSRFEEKAFWWYSTNEGPIFTLVEFARSTSHQLTMQKIRSITGQMIRDNKTLDQIVSVFKKRCYVWPVSCSFLPENQNDYDKVLRKLSWLVPYIQPYFLRIETNNLKTFSYVFRNMVMALRDRILRFVVVYYHVSGLSMKDKKLLKIDQRERFKAIMRGKEAQKKFLAGVPKDQIIEDIYTQEAPKFRNAWMKDVRMRAIEQSEKKKKVHLKEFGVWDESECLYPDAQPESLALQYEKEPTIIQQLIPYVLGFIGGYVWMRIWLFFWMRFIDPPRQQPRNIRVQPESMTYVNTDYYIGEFLKYVVTYLLLTGFGYCLVVIYQCIYNVIYPPKRARVIRMGCGAVRVQPESKPLEFIQDIYNWCIYFVDMNYFLTLRWFQWDTLRANLLTPFNWIGYAFLGVRAMNRVSNTSRRWKLMFVDPENNRMTNREKVVLVEIKALMHVIYYLYNNNKTEALAHASYGLITRCEKIITIIRKISTFSFRTELETDIIEFEFQGLVYNVRRADAHYLMDKPHNVLVEFFINREPVAEVGPESFPMITSLITQGASLLNMASLTDQQLRRYNMQFQLMGNVTRFTSDKLNFMAKIACYGARCVFGIDPLDNGFQRYTLEVMDWIRETDKIGRWPDGQLRNRKHIKYIMAHYEKGMTLRDNLRSYTLLQSLDIKFGKAFEDIKVKARTAMQANVGANKRFEPISVFVTGVPGTGKTVSMNKMTEEILIMEHTLQPDKYPKEFLPNMKFKPATNSDYWDGYCPQDGENGVMFVFLDDAFQTTDKLERAKQGLMLVEMVNSDSMPLNMANCESKNTVWFGSDYVFTSTNLANDGIHNCQFPVGLEDPAALKRRFHISLHRLTPCEDDAMDNSFRVDKCDIYPNVVGNFLSVTQCAQLIFDCKKQKDKLATKRETTIAEYEARIKMERVEWETFTPQPLVNVEPVREDIVPEVNSGKPPKFGTYGVDDEVTPEESERIVAGLIEMKVYEWWNSENANLYIGLAVTFASLFVLPFIWKFFFPDEEGILPESEGSSSHKMASGRKRKAMQRSKKLELRAAPHSLTEEYPYGDIDVQPHSNEENYEKSLLKIGEAACLIFTEEHGIARSGECSVCTHIADGIFLMTAHHWVKFVNKPDVVWKLKLHTGVVHVFSQPEEYVRILEDDMVAFRLPVKCNLPHSILKNTIPQKLRYPIPKGMPLQMVCLQQNGAIYFKDLIKNNLPDNWSYKSTGVENEQFHVVETITYWGRSEVGDSGSPIFIMGSQGKPYFIGIHIIGDRKPTQDKKFGAATPVSLEFLQTILDAFNDVAAESSSYEILPFPHKIDHHVPSNKRVISPTRSQIKHSVMWGYAGLPTCVPARLKPFVNPEGVFKDPYHIAVLKRHQEETIQPVDLTESIKFAMYLYEPDRLPRLLTKEEAINGIPGTNVTSICMGTSAGYDKCLLNGGKKGKEPFLIAKDDHFYYSPEMEKEIDDHVNNLQQGIQISVIYKDQLKDETREIQKGQIDGKTRLFSVGPLHQTILMRIYFGDFISFLQDKCVTHPVAVGIDPHSFEWSRLRNRLSKTDKSVIAGDFSNWDGVLPTFVMDAVCDFINQWYNDGEVNSRVRKLLFYHLTHPTNIHDDIIYMTVGGVPSGVGGTSTLNSVANMLMFYFILTVIFSLTVEEFNFSFYGDDNLVTIAREGFTCETLAPHFMQYFGMTYTHWSKKAGLDTVDTLDTCSFLSRKFVLDKGVYKAPLPIETIYEMTYWFRGGVTEEEAALAIAQSFFLELAHHSEEVYKKRATEYLVAVKRRMPHLEEAIREFNVPYNNWFTKRYVQARPGFIHKISEDN